MCAESFMNFIKLYTEKNSPIILTNLHILRRFRTKLHRSDRVQTDAVIVSVKRYLLHKNSQKTGYNYFF